MSEALERTDAARFKIEQLVDLVRNGSIRVPRFQRGLRWTSTDVERLFDSIYRGYPIGTLLFWERQADDEEIEIGPIRLRAPANSKALWVVDGQQRITSLAASLLPSDSRSPDPRFDLVFDLATERFVRLRSGEVRDTQLPLRSAYNLQQVLTWLRDRHLPSEMQDRAFRLADHLRNYEVPAYIVKAPEEEALRQIFDRTNTFGKRMTRAEVFQALHSSSEEHPSDLRALADEVNSAGYGELDDNTLLFCVLGVRDPDVLRDFHSEFGPHEDLAETFGLAKAAIERTIAFFKDDAAVPHLSLVPYQYLTVGLVRFFALHENPTDWERILLRRWFWRSAVHGPIARLGSTGTLRATTKAVQGKSAYNSIEALLELASNERRVPEIGNFRWNVADVRIAVSAMANLQPLDFVTGEPISSTEVIEARGRDALAVVIPRSTHDELARTIANRVFVSSEEAWSGDSTVEELALAIATADDRILASHAITPKAAAKLRDGESTHFLELRRLELQERIGAFVDARAEWKRPSRPAIGDLKLAASDV